MIANQEWVGRIASSISLAVERQNMPPAAPSGLLSTAPINQKVCRSEFRGKKAPEFRVSNTREFRRNNTPKSHPMGAAESVFFETSVPPVVFSATRSFFEGGKAVVKRRNPQLNGPPR